MRCHGQHIFGGVQVPHIRGVIALFCGYSGGGSVTKNRLIAAHLPHEFLRRGLDDSAVGTAGHSAVGDFVPPGPGEGGGVVGVAAFAQQPGVPAGAGT